MVEGFICEYNDKGGLLLQKGQMMEGLLIKMEKCKGVRAKLPFSFLSPATKTGEGERAASAARSGGPGGSVAVRGVGERERAPREVDSRPQLERRWPVGAWPQRPAAATVEAALQGSTATQSWGKRGRGPRGFYCAPYLGQRWRKEAAP